MLGVGVHPPRRWPPSAQLEGGLAEALSELCSGGLLTEVAPAGPIPPSASATPSSRRPLIEGFSEDQRRQPSRPGRLGLGGGRQPGRLEEVAGTLGHHFAMAGELGRAAHYLELAGDHAASAFANDEAVASYRYALDLIERDGIDKPGPVSNTTVRAETELRLKLALVLSTMARYAEARDTLLQGLRLVGDSDELLAACLQSRLGWVELDVHEYDPLSSRSNQQQRCLAPDRRHLEPRLFEVWLDSQLGLGEVYYWRDEPDRMAAVLGRVSPVMRARGYRGESGLITTSRSSCGNLRNDVTVSTRRSLTTLERP